MSGPKDIGGCDRVNVANGKTPLGRVRGLGAARHGGGHWLHERLTSVGLLMLGTWFLASMLLLPSFDYKTIVDWLRSPLAAVPMALFVYLSFAHSYDGMKVIIDDYQGEEGGRLMWSAISLFLHIGVGAIALFALARIAFGANA